MQEIIHHFAHRLLAVAADLAPGHRHRAHKRADQATEEDKRRDRNGNPGYEQRHEGRPKGRQIQYCRYDDGMGVAEAGIIQQQTTHSNSENNSQFPVIRGIPQQSKEVAATGRMERQQRNRDEQGDLGQAHELNGTQAMGGGKGEWFLCRQKAGGDQRIQGSKPVIRGGCGIRHLRDAPRVSPLSI